MDVDELSLIGSFDLANVDAIHRKRLLAFVNHFIVQTSQFLNKLACSCEGKLLQTELRLQKLEAALILLESKLGSIPGLAQTIPVDPVVNIEPDVTVAALSEDTEESVPQEAKEEESETVLDESLVRFTKMLHFGVPLPAVKLKMEQEGIPPDKQALVLNLSK